MARPELPGAAVPHSVACFSISVGGSHPLFQPSAKNALLFFVWLWYIGLEIVKAALKSSIFLFFLEQLCYFNLSPQGDENTHNRRCRWGWKDFNLSPQGDENLYQHQRCRPRNRFQLIPARGRKLYHPAARLLPFPFQLIPARGRKRFSGLGFDITLVLFQLIPARGRKHHSELATKPESNISTYPRKGTKTPDIPALVRFYQISTYPRKGTKTPSMPRGLTAVTRFQLIPARGRKLNCSCDQHPT